MPRTFLIFILAVVIGTFNGISCQRDAKRFAAMCARYGHSCLGAHGKRSGPGSALPYSSSIGSTSPNHASPHQIDGSKGCHAGKQRCSKLLELLSIRGKSPYEVMLV
ncbi:uncharacterized protein LOC136031080 [Artemia franciscana]|uniref:Uncharacterized protein n=1 Tax=Artemia franciscana TaxID=6661 RepID=A0AA88HCF1_ARTSF|nr:hypothetical protein QYM36_017084 [Artemia franciscana]